MSRILVLGSKPGPALPPRTSIDALACANASGRSAESLGLPRPTLTVMSAILTSGIASGEQSIEALSGLSTQELWYYARPKKRRSFLGLRKKGDDARLMTPTVLEERLAGVDYRFRSLQVEDNDWWRKLVLESGGGGAELAAAIERKQPSTGMAAIALALHLGRWTEVCVAGFSFELTHAYGENPEIRERGTQASKHADTDIAVLSAMARCHPGLCTTEILVHERCGLRLVDSLSENAPA